MRYSPYLPVMAVTLLVAGACKKEATPKATTVGVPDFHNPADPGFAQQAPDSFRARFSTTKGDFVIAVHRAWAPLGADRFYNLVRSGYYDGVRFFRVLPGFMAQFGIHGDTAVTAAWRERVIRDDPVRAPHRSSSTTPTTAGSMGWGSRRSVRSWKGRTSSASCTAATAKALRRAVGRTSTA